MDQFIRKGTTQEQASLVAQMVRNPPAMRETWVRSLGWEDPGEGNGNPVFLVGESPWTEEPGGLQSWGHKESDTTEQLSTITGKYKRCTEQGMGEGRREELP